MSDNKEKFKQYIQGKKVLIVDEAIAIRASVARTIIALGADSQNVHLSSEYDQAVQLMAEQKPDVVICEYDLGPRCGLDLLQEQRRAHPESRKSVFILVTHDSSQTAVARAAEEDIDNYVLKPYTPDSLSEAIIRAAMAKEWPSPYYLKIEEGKSVLFAGNPGGSMPIFEQAMKLDPKPTLACFYHGQAHLLQQALDDAKARYDEGLTFNNIHYKCITGLFDVLMKKQQYDEAYKVVNKISRYFPANPKRLTTVLHLAVLTKNYEDIERYYQTFTKIDVRSEELMRYVCAALVTCGKAYLGNRVVPRAIELFEKASLYSAERPHILREIMVALRAAGFKKESASFLKVFAAKMQTRPEYLAMKYLIDDDNATSIAASISAGEDLIHCGVLDPELYLVLIARYVQNKEPEKAEQLAKIAIELFPEKKEELSKASLPPEAK